MLKGLILSNIIQLPHSEVPVPVFRFFNKTASGGRRNALGEMEEVFGVVDSLDLL